ncbi:MAG: hypothetical protein HGA38_02670 [Candidatus Moranbacteria bacterium]|nr:hypothetical protein [Candidatus Moranbacteria bacterium]
MKNGSEIPNVDYLGDFQKELSDIDKLEQTPALIKMMSIAALQKAMDTPGVGPGIRRSLENTKMGLENIKEGSIRRNYSIIYSQMCILAVSSLEATLKKYFENALNGFNNINQENKELEGIRITLAELVTNNLSYRSGFGSLVLEKAKLNFQDFQAIKRNFKNYLSKEIGLDSEIEKRICFYLELRHVLVHKGGIIDKKFVDATTSFEANIKDYQEDNRAVVDSNDWSAIKTSFSALVQNLTQYNPKS